MVEHPRLLLALARKLPRGLAFALSPESEKNEDSQRDFPRQLARLELRGNGLRPDRVCAQPPRSGAAAQAVAGPARCPRRRRQALRALIVTDSLPAADRGRQPQLELLARNLTDRGHTVAIATAWQPGAPGRRGRGRGAGAPPARPTSRMRWISEDPYKHNPPPFPDPEARLAAAAADQASFEPDLVHAYGWLAHSAAAALLGLRDPAAALRPRLRKRLRGAHPGPQEARSARDRRR